MKKKDSVAPAKKIDRRKMITRALQNLIIRKGYAEITITEIAREAGLSLSHLLYYYAKKTDILADLADDHHRRFRERFNVHRDKSPVERIDAIAEQMFMGPADRDIMLVHEFFGQVRHNPALAATMSEHADLMFENFRDLFSLTPRQPGFSADDAAELAGSLWLGLISQYSAHRTLSDRDAQRLLRNTLRVLANIGAADEAAPAAVSTAHG